MLVRRRAHSIASTAVPGWTRLRTPLSTVSYSGEGSPHAAFEVSQRRSIPDLGNVDCVVYKHLKTGSTLLSLRADDDNKVFGVAFRTPPTDSTGVAHILEHSVLCGSRKYPVKEPFVELLKSSLQVRCRSFPSQPPLALLPSCRRPSPLKGKCAQ